MALALALCGAGSVRAAPGPSADELKRLSLEDLLTMEVISVSRFAEPLHRVASAIQVISREDIRRSGAHTLPEALRLAVNLSVARIDARDWAVSARGFNARTSNKLLVLLDGRTLYTPLFAGVFWDVQDVVLEDVERIEVVSGPGAVQWGENAVNGVINVVTRSAAASSGLLLDVAAGTEHRAVASFRQGGVVRDGLAARVYGKHVAQDESAVAGGGGAGDGWRVTRGGFRVDWDGGEGDRVSVQAEGYAGSLDRPLAAATTVAGGHVLGSWSRHGPDAGSSHELLGYLDVTERRIPGQFGESLAQLAVEYQHRLRAGDRHDLVLGAAWRHARDDVDNTPALAFLPARRHLDWFGAFVQDEVALVGDRLSAMLGIRADHNEYTGLELQPSARLRWIATERAMLWAAVSRAVRTPSRIDRELFVPGEEPFRIAGGPRFESERLVAVEAGARLRLGDRVGGALTLFHHDYDRLRSVEPAPPPDPAPAAIANGLEGSGLGLELSAEIQVLACWRLRAGLAALDLDIDAVPGSRDASRGSAEAQDPGHQVVVHSFLDLPARLTLDAGLRRVGRIDDPLVPGYAELDLRLGWLARDGLELALAGRNLLHPRHAELGSPAARRLVERSLVGNVTCRF